jgi:hypothetical protein
MRRLPCLPALDVPSAFVAPAVVGLIALKVAR